MTRYRTHRRLATAAMAAAMLAVPSGAGATTTVVGDTSDYAVASLAHSRLPTPNMTVTLVDGSCGIYEADACYDPDTNTIYSPPYNVTIFLHELAHAYDVQLMNEATRDWFARQSSANAGVEPHERFADLYAACAEDPLATGRMIEVAGWGGSYPRRIYQRICRRMRYHLPQTSWQTGRAARWTTAWWAR